MTQIVHGKAELWIFWGWLSPTPRCLARASSSWPPSLPHLSRGLQRPGQRLRVRCECSSDTTMACATVNASRCLIGCQYVRRGVRRSTAAFITAFASLELAASTRPTAPITLVSLGRSNEGVCGGQRQPVPHRLSVRAAWRAMQRRGAS